MGAFGKTGAAVVLSVMLCGLLAAWGCSGLVSGEGETDEAQSRQSEPAERAEPEEAKTEEPVLRDALDAGMGTLVANEPGHQAYRIAATGPAVKFAGSFSSSGMTGTGRLTVKLLDENQELVKVIGSADGADVVRQEIDVVPGAIYYVVVEWDRGYWTLRWEGAQAA